MTLRVGKLVYGMIRLLPCLLAVLLASSCSSDVNSDEQKGDKTLVTLTIAASGNAATASRAISGNSSTVTRAGVSDSGDKDYYISDLTVMIFDESGYVIGSTTKKASDLTPSSDGKFTIQVLTRAAQNCTVYAIANALALNGDNTPFAGIATLSALKSMVKTYTNADDINTETCLLMMGKTDDNSFDTTNSGSAAAISLQRLASKIDFKFTVNDDQTTGFPIVVDSYQLCNVPTSTLYQQSDFTNPSMPSVSASTSLYQSLEPIAGTQKNYTCYVYTNIGTGTSKDKETYLDIQAHSEVQGAGGTKYTVWKSNFQVKMPGNHVLPNYHYKINIVINGSVEGKNGGFIITYNAYPYFSGSILKPWQPEETDRNLDLQ